MKLTLKSRAIRACTVSLGPVIELLAKGDTLKRNVTQLNRRASWSFVRLAALDLFHGNVRSRLTIAVSGAGPRTQACKQGRSTGVRSTALVKHGCHSDRPKNDHNKTTRESTIPNETSQLRPRVRRTNRPTPTPSMAARKALDATASRWCWINRSSGRRERRKKPSRCAS